MGVRGTILTLLVSGSLALLTGLACNFGGDHGEPCLHDESCASGTCRWGICVTGTCSGNAGCMDGWSCVDPPPSSNGAFLDALFGKNDPIGYCALDCDGCPDDPRYACESICTFDHTPHLEIVAPLAAVVGETVSLIGIADLVEGRELASAVWTVTNYSQGGELELEGLSLEHVFSTYGDHELLLTVIDSGEVSAMTSVHIDVCQADGGACSSDFECCGEGYCDQGACHPAAVCGNGVIERNELCDGPVADGTVCTDFDGHEGGPLQCSSDCRDYDLNSCDTCSDTLDFCDSDDDCCAGLTCSQNVEFCS